jgi:hypothetical protein
MCLVADPFGLVVSAHQSLKTLSGSAASCFGLATLLFFASWVPFYHAGFSQTGIESIRPHVRPECGAMHFITSPVSIAPTGSEPRAWFTYLDSDDLRCRVFQPARCASMSASSCRRRSGPFQFQLSRLSPLAGFGEADSWECSGPDPASYGVHYQAEHPAFGAFEAEAFGAHGHGGQRRPEAALSSSSIAHSL